jgi:hypothetical protein
MPLFTYFSILQLLQAMESRCMESMDLKGQFNISIGFGKTIHFFQS